MNRAIFVTVRTGSSRLPNKSILKIKNKYTIEYVINSVKNSKYADKIILCTTDLKQDEILCDIASKNNIDFYQGDEHNKSKRWYGACKKFNIDFFVTADGDDLFYDAGLSDLCFEQIEDDYIDGQGLYNDVYGMTTKALKMCLDSSNDKNIEPHDMIQFFKSISLKGKKLSNVPEIYKKKNIRMTLDYKEDFMFFSEVINKIKLDFNIKDVLYYIDRNPNVININYHREQDWQKNQGKTK
tara:strand:- start:649 stop:1368 length:720 start_codon:yes stop_codon:yes gene_type:complete